MYNRWDMCNGSKQKGYKGSDLENKEEVKLEIVKDLWSESSIYIEESMSRRGNVRHAVME